MYNASMYNTSYFQCSKSVAMYNTERNCNWEQVLCLNQKSPIYNSLFGCLKCTSYYFVHNFRPKSTAKQGFSV